MKKTGAGGDPQNYDKATGRYAFVIHFRDKEVVTTK